MTPKVSIIIPVYNPNIKFFKQCLDSILNQTYKNFELIIILKKSKNIELNKETNNLIQNYCDSRIVQIVQNHQGIANARNLGVSKSHGEFIALMDSDDISDESRIEKQVEFFNNNDADIVGSISKIIDENNKQLGLFRVPLEPKDIRRSILIASPFVNGSIMFKKSIINNSGFYNESFPTSEDYEFFIWHIAKGARCYNINEPLYSHREHNNSLNMKIGFRFGYYYVYAKLRGIKLGLHTPRDLFFLILTLPAFFFNRKINLFAYRTVGRLFSRTIKSS